jgi:antitoxin ParD1/3/4
MPKTMRRYVKARIARGGYGNASEYFRDLVRREQARVAQREVEARLLNSLRRGEAQPMTAATWAEIRETVCKRLKQRA